MGRRRDARLGGDRLGTFPAQCFWVQRPSRSHSGASLAGEPPSEGAMATACPSGSRRSGRPGTCSPQGSRQRADQARGGDTGLSPRKSPKRVGTEPPRKRVKGRRGLRSPGSRRAGRWTGVGVRRRDRLLWVYDVLSKATPWLTAAAWVWACGFSSDKVPTEGP